MNTTTTEPEKKKGWQNDTTDPAGKIQVKRVNDAIRSLGHEHGAFIEKIGTIGVDERQYEYIQLFGGSRPDVAAVQIKIGEEFNWTVSKKNVNAIIARIEAELPTLRANRPVQDKRLTVEATAARDAANAKARDEREAAEAVKEAARQTERATLLAQYRHLEPESPRCSGRVLAAKNIRTELTAAFPGHRFSVTGDSYSGGDSITVKWEMGPTTREIEAIIGKYKKGNFCGMTDSFTYSDDQFHRVFGGARHTSASRDVDHEALCLPLCIALGITPPENPRWQGVVVDTDAAYPTSISNLAFQIAYAHAYPPHAKLTGVETTEESDDNGDYSPAQVSPLSRTFRPIYTCPAYQDIPAPVTTPDGVTVRENEEKDGIEIHFASKPSPETIASLKGARFRWAMSSKCWYARRTPSNVAFAHRIAGTTQPTDDNASHEDAQCAAVAA